jgi:hypothetical protein
VIEIPVVFSRQFFLDKENYIANLPLKPPRETKEERAARFQRLMDDNGWIRAELARQLGVSRAWITKVLGTPAVAEFCDEIGERGGHFLPSATALRAA